MTLWRINTDKVTEQVDHGHVLEGVHVGRHVVAHSETAVVHNQRQANAVDNEHGQKSEDTRKHGPLISIQRTEDDE